MAVLCTFVYYIVCYLIWDRTHGSTMCICMLYCMLLNLGQNLWQDYVHLYVILYVT